MNDKSTNQTLMDQMLRYYELNNLIPGSWYELTIKANTEAGFVVREYVFATKKLDGSTIAPLTLKAIDGHLAKHQNSFGNTLYTLRSSVFAQLHYIVPVTCTLFILFLVTVVVCAIQTNNRNRFLLSFVAQRNRHKVSSGKLSSSIYETATITTEQTGSVLMHDGVTTAEPSIGTGSGVNYCNKEHIYSSGVLGKLGDGESRFNPRSDSMHSLANVTGATGEPNESSLHFESMNMMKMCETNGSKGQQYPLYSLPVPYATSTVKFSNSNTGSVPESTNASNYTSEPIYGINRWNKGQLSEMYCDSVTKSGLVQLDEQGFPRSQPVTFPPPPNTANGTLANSGKRGSNGSHQYELPFVFKVNQNESTAF